jgi:predicted DNA-binding ribbon-helix-helix protein
MPSTLVGKVVRRGRPPGEPTAVRSVRLPATMWDHLERLAAEASTTVNALIRAKLS